MVEHIIAPDGHHGPGCAGCLKLAQLTELRTLRDKLAAAEATIASQAAALERVARQEMGKMGKSSKPRCDLVAPDGLGRCWGAAIAVRFEDGFTDLVCEKHATSVESRGGLVIRPAGESRG